MQGRLVYLNIDIAARPQKVFGPKFEICTFFFFIILRILANVLQRCMVESYITAGLFLNLLIVRFRISLWLSQKLDLNSAKMLFKKVFHSHISVYSIYVTPP